MNIDERENYNPGDAYSQEEVNQYKENDIDSGPLDNAFNEEEEDIEPNFSEGEDFDEDDALDIEEDDIDEEDPLEDADDFEEEEDFEDDELEEDELEEEDDETTDNDDFNENDLNVDDPQNPHIF